jgi:hypothetical protein
MEDCRLPDLEPGAVEIALHNASNLQIGSSARDLFALRGEKGAGKMWVSICDREVY